MKQKQKNANQTKKKTVDIKCKNSIAKRKLNKSSLKYPSTP